MATENYTLRISNTYYGLPPYTTHDFAYYRNSHDYAVQINSIDLPLGTGNGYFFDGDPVTGNGQTFYIQLIVSGQRTQTEGISNVMNATSSGYPIRSQAVTRTFIFDSPPVVQPGATVSLEWTTSGSGSCLCTNYDITTMDVGPVGYTVTFDLAGGTRTGGGELVQTIAPGGNAIPPTCTRPGYTFRGWDGSYTNVTSNRTITALWDGSTYTISYNANGGTGAPANQTKTQDVPLTLSSQVPRKTVRVTYDPNGGTVSPTYADRDLKFKNWNTNQSGSGTSYSPGGQYTANASATLYAQWDPATMGDLPTPTNGDEEFLGWYDKRDGGRRVQSYYVFNTDITIYARWSVTVIFDANGGTLDIGDGVSRKTYEVKKNGTNPVPIPESYVCYKQKTDPDSSFYWEFKGWSTNPNATSPQYRPGSQYTGDTSVTLYAVYTGPTYTVTFEDGYSGRVLKTERVQYGGDATPPPNPTRPGYRFYGWIGNYQNVMADSTVRALWEIAFVWIMSSTGWIPYKPTDGEANE